MSNDPFATIKCYDYDNDKSVLSSSYRCNDISLYTFLPCRWIKNPNAKPM